MEKSGRGQKAIRCRSPCLQALLTNAKGTQLNLEGLYLQGTLHGRRLCWTGRPQERPAAREASQARPCLVSEKSFLAQLNAMDSERTSARIRPPHHGKTNYLFDMKDAWKPGAVATGQLLGSLCWDARACVALAWLSVCVFAFCRFLFARARLRSFVLVCLLVCLFVVCLFVCWLGCLFACWLGRASRCQSVSTFCPPFLAFARACAACCATRRAIWHATRCCEPICSCRAAHDLWEMHPPGERLLRTDGA